MKKTMIAITLVVIFTFALATPALASYLEHEATYKLEGSITFSQQAGHWCNTGAEMQQRITGQGSIVKSKDVYMEEGMIAVADNNDWVTAPDAIRNLTVTTAIWLCAPAKSEFGNIDLIGYLEEYWRALPWNALINGSTSPLRPGIGDNPLTWDYLETYHLATYNLWKPVQDQLDAGGVIDPETLYSMLMNEPPFDPGYSGPSLADLNINWENLVDPLTDQVWAVQVAANPGYSGQIDMSFEAANSNNWVSGKSDPDAYNGFWFADAGYEDWPGYTEQKKGPWFPGSYFNIEQFSRTSSGTHRRYIDISSPWTHGYLSETMTVTGMSEVWEAFSMDNLTAGDEVAIAWWKLF